MSIPKVLIISHMYPSDADPVDGIFIHRGVQALIKRGNVEIFVISSVPWAPCFLRHKLKWKKWADVQKTKLFDGVRTVRPAHVEIPLKFFWPYRGVSMAFRLLPVLVALKRQFPFDVIHTHTITPDGLAGIILGWWFKVPTICSIRGSDINSYPFRSHRYYSFSRMVLKKTDMILANNRPILDKASKIASQNINIHCIYNGVDKNIFYPETDKLGLRCELGLPKTSLVLIFVGNCIVSKGLPELIDTFIYLAKHRSEIHLVVVGSGPLVPEIRNQIMVAGLEKQMTMTGRIPQSAMAKFLRASDIFALPSHNEGMPNAMLEAMACGVPPVVTPVGGVVEVVEDGVDGLLHPVNNQLLLQKALIRLLEDDSLRESIGKAANKKVSHKFSWKSHAKEHEKIYSRVLLNGSRFCS